MLRLNNYKGKWPPGMGSGVIFWDGLRITLEDFNSYKEKAK